MLQGIKAALTAKDTWESGWLMISVGSAPAVDDSFYKHQAVPFSNIGLDRHKSSLEIGREIHNIWILQTKSAEPSFNQRMPVIGIRDLMFVYIVIYGSLKPGNGFSLKLPGYFMNGRIGNFAAPRVKFTMVGKA